MLSQSLVPIIPFGALPTDYTRVKDSKQFSSFARTRTRFVRCLFLPTLPFRFLYCPGNFDDAWNIYFAFQCSEFRRNENVAAIRKIQSGWPVPFTLAIPSLKFLGDFRTFLAWSGHQLGHAQSSTVCLHDYTFPSKHTLCKFLASDYECNRNSAWNIGIDPSARENKLFQVCYEFLELIFFLLLRGILRKFGFQFESFRTRLWGEMR